MKKIEINAEGKKLGRVAAEAAKYLLGKDSVDYVQNEIMGAKVSVVNASKMDISEKQLKNNTYKSFSGYPGGLAIKSMERVIEKHGYSEILKLAIYGMLPGNKLRQPRLNNLTITE